MFERYKIFIALLLEFTFPHSLNAQVQILFPNDTNSKVYFMGEDHRYNKKNNKTSYDLFEYLVKNKGVKNFIYELPISQSFLFNEALRNPSCRKKLWRDITIELSRDKKLIELIKNRDLQLFGIDVETDEYSTKESIIYILDQIESKGINIDSLLGTNFKQRIKYDHNIEFKMDIAILDSILKLDPTQYSAIFGKYYNILSLILKGSKIGQLNHDDPLYESLREEFMFNNFKLILTDTNISGKFYGRFGLLHILKKMIDKDDPLFNDKNNRSFISMLLSTGNITFDSIMSFAIYYKSESISDQTFGLLSSDDKNILNHLKSGTFISPYIHSRFAYLYGKVDYILILD